MEGCGAYGLTLCFGIGTAQIFKIPQIFGNLPCELRRLGENHGKRQLSYKFPMDTPF